MAKNIKDFSDHTISELIDSLTPHERLELDRPAVTITNDAGINFLTINYSFDPELFNLSDSKLEKVTQTLEKGTGLPSWHTTVDDTTVLVCIAIPRCDFVVGEFFAPTGDGTHLIEDIHRIVRDS